MNALVENILNLLQDHQLVESYRVINFDETPAGKIELKIRCRLSNNYKFQIWLHHGITFHNYSFQLFTDRPILRWDNAPHYPDISTAPHHFHNETGQVTESPLSGDMLKDLVFILVEIEKWMKT